MKPRLPLTALLLAPLAALAAAEDSGSTFAQIARPHPRPAGAPKSAEVSFSTRWPRPTNRADNRDSFQSARDFHATRLDWLYLSGKPEFDRAFVSKFKTAGYRVGGTLNCQPTDSPTGTNRVFSIGRTVNLKGEPLKDPWTRKYGGRFCCPNNPDYAKVYLTHARYALEAGVDHFQMDGPELNDLMSHFGGCFCAHCVRGFREYLASRSTPGQRAQWGVADLAAFDYARFLLALGTDPDTDISLWKGPVELRELFRTFQIESGLRFLGDMHQQIDRMAGRNLAYSCNASHDFLTVYHKVFDFAVNEAYPSEEGEPAFLYHQRIEPAQKLGKPMLFAFVSHDVAHHRRFIASGYALGTNAIVPWDVFTGLDAPRFFGTPEQFSDLFGFIRAQAALLEGYEEAGVFGPGIRDSRYSEGQPPLRVHAGSPVFAVIRAKPDQGDLPVVIHLVAATNGKTGPLRLTFDPFRYFGGRPLKMRFLTPPPYDPTAHEKAEASGDYAPLSTTTELPGGRISTVDLPGIDPWGILVLEPSGEGATTPWQPAIWCDEKSRFGESLQVCLDCPTRDAEIRYTIDGSAPSKTSPLYEKPLQFNTTTAIQAIAFGRDGAASPEVSARFERAKARPRLAPDASALVENLKLWLKADTLAATLQDGAPVTNWPATVGPAANIPTLKLLSGAKAGAPTFVAALLNGRPGVRFDGVDDQLSVPGFANGCLAGKPFTVFLVTQSPDPLFGVGGNAANGSGGIPRLYLTRALFHHDRLTGSIPVGASPGTTTVTVYQHDGKNSASARSSGRLTGKRGDLPAIKEFGSGGHLAVPLWSGLTNHAGDLGEIIAYDRQLTVSEVEAIEEDLAARYVLHTTPRWN